MADAGESDRGRPPQPRGASRDASLPTADAGLGHEPRLERPDELELQQCEQESLREQHQQHLHLHPLHHHGMMHDDGTLHYEEVRQQGRSASLVRDDEGHIVYPSLVPPAVESPTSSVNGEAAAHYFQLPPSQPAEPDGRAGTLAGAVAAADGAVVQTSTEAVTVAGNVQASGDGAGAGAGAVPTAPRRRDSDAMNTAPIRRPARTRSSTVPSQPKCNRSDVALVRELRRTPTLHWDLDECPAHDAALFASPPPPPPPGPATSAAAAAAAAPAPPPRASSSLWKMRPAQKAPTDASSSDPGRHIYRNYFNSQTFRRDGRLPISVKDTSHAGALAKAVGAAVRRITQGESDADDEPSSGTDAEGEPDAYAAAADAKDVSSAAAADFSRLSCTLAHRRPPRLNIVIMVIGSRGDIQPFLKIGKILKSKYGHRVRVATHPAFRDFIEKDAGLEFFSAGGDPAELMAFMVKNPGMIPSMATVRSGDIGRRRDAMAEMFDGFWRACVDATDDPSDIHNLKLVGDKEPFVADAIIANPPSYAHVHCAEALGVPLHLMFTFPYTPTQAFPHPLANVKSSSVDPGYTNFISYPLIDMMVWQGLGDLVNNFRVRTLDLDPISTIWAPGAVYRMHVPFTYLWSPGLIPKPDDWGPEIDIGGFVFLELASSFTPPPSLEAFLAASDEPPVYIGFGSIVVDDADSFTDMIFKAVEMAGVRALVSKGWGGFGGKGGSVPDNIYMLENTPHDWLFPQVRACVIHGGAGTTAMALKCGLPIMVVPFFGDQYFWGSMIEKSKVGPKPVPYKHLTAERLADGIRHLLGKEARAAAQTIAAAIEREGDGAENACKSFLRTLELEGQNSMRCSIFPERMAVWQRKGSNIKFSALAAEALVQRGYMTYKNLRLLRHTEWNDFEGPGEPITAMVESLGRSFRDVISGPFSAIGHIIHGGKQSKKRRKDAKAKSGGGGRSSSSSGGSGSKAKEAKKANGKALNGSARDLAEADTLGGGGDDDAGFASGDSQLDFVGTGKAEEGSFELVFAAVGKSVGQSAVALAMAPIELYYALCQGFHNAPRLYGDDTVRRPLHITGIKSGMKAAGQEFVFGIFDGVTGVVRLPIRFARKGGGVHGFVLGIGMGLMGFVLKDISAILGPLGYALKGLARQAERSHQPVWYVRKARMVQAQREVRALSPEAWRHISDKAVAGWESLHALYETVQQHVHKDAPRAKTTDGLEANNGDGAVAVAGAGAGHHPTPPRLLDGIARRASNDSVFQHHHYHGVGASARRSLEDMDAALENADLAAIVLAAMRRGETLESVVRGRHSRRHAHRRLCQPCRLGGSPERDLNKLVRAQLSKKWQTIEQKSGADDDDDETAASPMREKVAASEVGGPSGSRGKTG